MNQKQFWIGFNHVRGIGAVRLKMLLDYFGNLDEAWKASPVYLKQAGLSQKIVDNIIQIRQELNLDEIWDELARKQIDILTWEDEQYPALLKQIGQPPPVLYIRGSLLPEDELAISIVGTRRMSYYGKQVAEELAGRMAEYGVTVVSGLARGVDGAAHEACLNASGRTLAVLGCGVDTIYPPEHRKLSERICENGALISDYAPGTPPDSINFPPRNRIISGLSLATIVVEAGERSGALITASFAAEQGREVFAVPGSIYRDQCKGANHLISKGARPLINMDDLLETLQIYRESEGKPVKLPSYLDDIEVSILQILRKEAHHVDEIGKITGLPIEKITSTLTIMELKGYIRHIGAMNYIAVENAFE